MALVEAGRYYNSIEAGMARARLEAEGIPSFIFDMEMNWGWSDGLIMIRLMVDDEDLSRASEILNASGSPAAD
ncbi:putative signal transducing protein [Sphingosinicella sp.]|uniref:putative signal transducing protein n=1 Tax=Sphingosinicella sp. TaxID=1917971 RepID=UPI0040383D5C